MLNLDNTSKVEIRVKTAMDGKSWNERPVDLTFLVAPDENNTLMVVGSAPELRLSEAVVRSARSLHPLAVEVRWNFEGSPQGHYLDC